MAMHTQTNDVSGVLPEDYGSLVTQPVSEQSMAYLLSTVNRTTRERMNFPIVTGDPSAGWIAELDEIPLSDAEMAEVTVVPQKIAGLTKVSAELASDSSPGAANIVGQGMARDIVRQVDTAFFGETTTNGPAGLESVSGVNVINDAGSPIVVTNLDPFITAQSSAEQEGRVITAFAASPSDVEKLAQLKDEDGSNRPLLGVDPTNPVRRMIQGTPLVPTRFCPTGTIWGVPAEAVQLVQRQGATVETDASVFFTQHAVALRAVMRLSWGFVHAAAIQKLSVSL